MRATVPGNLLLLGEYAVTEAGGLGVAVAVEPRVKVEVRPARELVIVGETAAGEIRWPGPQAGLLAAVVEAVCAGLGLSSAELLPRAEIRVDSTALGKGLGSSAAVAVALASALLALAGLEGEQMREAAAHAALLAHRAFQGGRGSGYDVAASLHGGIGLFEGGEEPSWTPLALPWLGPMRLVRGEGGVVTSMAVARYEEWKRRHPRSARDFLSASNRAVAGFASARAWEEAAAWFEAARALGLELGRAIGVSAEIRLPEAAPGGEGARASLYKAVGAGNELAVWLAGEGPAASDATAAPGEPVRVAEQGLVIED